MGLVALAVGSRGDVQPLASLCGELARQGVDATVVALAEYAGLVTAAGARFAPIDASLASALDAANTGGGRLLSRTPAGQAVLLKRWTSELAEPLADAVLPVVQPGDAVLTGVLTRDVATALAEARGCRPATVVYTGQLPTAERASHLMPGYFTPWASYNRWGSRLSWRIASGLGAATGSAVRRRLGLPHPRHPLDADRFPIIVAASPVLVPTASDWGSGVHQTGYLAPRPASFTPDADLATFLGCPGVTDAARAVSRPGGSDSRRVAPVAPVAPGVDTPVYVGYGSFTGGATARDVQLIVDAAVRSGRRVLTPAVPGLAEGRIAPDVLAIRAVPHEWLFPRLAGVVHHGGAGTTHTGLRAGVPSAAVPFGVDQPYHAWRLVQLGVGPRAPGIRRLTADRLARVLEELGDPRYRERAAEVGERVRREDGVRDTVALLERWGYLG